jgi:hypothetical protein
VPRTGKIQARRLNAGQMRQSIFFSIARVLRTRIAAAEPFACALNDDVSGANRCRFSAARLPSGAPAP